MDSWCACFCVPFHILEINFKVGLFKVKFIINSESRVELSGISNVFTNSTLYVSTFLTTAEMLLAKTDGIGYTHLLLASFRTMILGLFFILCICQDFCYGFKTLLQLIGRLHTSLISVP